MSTKKWTDIYYHFEGPFSFRGKINLSADDESLKKGIWGGPAFTTAMSGYQETITDPSYLGEFIIFAYPHIGNYPFDQNVSQAEFPAAKALFARNFHHNPYLEQLKIPLVKDIDTRALIKFISSGEASHKSVISLDPTAPSTQEFAQAELDCNKLTLVSQSEVICEIPGERPIAVINYGMKKNILRELKNLGFPLVSFPYNAKIQDILSVNPRLCFLSNGPGDPALYTEQIQVVKELLTKNIPLRAICLGHQLTALSLGASTYRLPFGHRGINHPVYDHINDKVLITSQNHGYALEDKSLKNILSDSLFVSHSSLFDRSVEGLQSTDGLIKTVQFHPEANPGPHDAKSFFGEIKTYLEKGAQSAFNISTLKSPPEIIGTTYKKETPYKKILVIGSGPIKIGQASEFDYSGTQACRALMNEGIEVVLLNSNPATIMTDKEISSRTYIEPITKETVKNIILKEKVTAVLSTMGGQTALNTSLSLAEEGFFEQHKIALLGASAETIEKTEDREIFSSILDSLGLKTGKRVQAYSYDEALKVAEKEIGLPLIIRRNFALGGQGAAIIDSMDELKILLDPNFKFPVTLEKSLHGFKEVELEVMVDKDNNGVVICSIENIDPCGVHTGDSITVAPVQTISDHCYQNLRTQALTVAKEMGVVAGGANVQFAINPDDENDIVVIEMNPRVSRSSALASKATGYPIAKISALLSIGYTLKEILNDITKVSPVSFEPTLDYVAVKIPKFPFSKFPSSSRQLGPQMRSVGEVLALGSNFNEAFLKGLRALENGLEIPRLDRVKTIPIDLDQIEQIKNRLKDGMQLSLVTCMEAFRRGLSAEEISSMSHISPWFVEQMNALVKKEKQIINNPALLEDVDFYISLKAAGFSDDHLSELSGKSVHALLDFRSKHKIKPVYKSVDTCSGEFQAFTPYFYSTYQQYNEAIPFEKNSSVIVIGSGPNRIGQGIEFDYSCVKACQALKKRNLKSIMINSNPETVSTDYDSSDRLYLAPLFWEDLLDIFNHENPRGVITSFSGQTGIKTRTVFEKTFIKEFHRTHFLGPSIETLDLCENRQQFDQVLSRVNVQKTQALEVKGFAKLIDAINQIGHPVIIRPSYVIGGESMYIFRNHDELDSLPENLKKGLQDPSASFLVENYIENAIEYDVDLIRDSSNHTIYSVCEHIEYAGVHSGDSGMITPPVQLGHKICQQLKNVSKHLAQELNIIGPVNFQFAVKGEKIYCIEANPRGSRTLPFLSKAYNISLPEFALEALLGNEIPNIDDDKLPYFCVKQSTFPFDRFLDDSSILGPKMRSTGETMGIDPIHGAALLKSYLGNFPKLLGGGKILFSLSNTTKPIVLPYLRFLKDLNIEFFATSGTARYLQEEGFQCQSVGKIGEEGFSIPDLLKDPEMKIVINTPLNQGKSKSDGALIRENAIANGVASFTRPENIVSILKALTITSGQGLKPVCLQELNQ